MLYIIVALIIIGFLCKVAAYLLKPIVQNQEKRKQIADPEEPIMIEEKEGAKPGELIVKLSMNPIAISKIKKQVDSKILDLSGIDIDKKTVKEFPLRKKQYISADEFRFEGEEDYIIRLEQSPPIGFNNKIFEKVMVESISWRSREDAINSFIYGSNRSLILERSSSKKYGIKIIGRWQSIRKIRQAPLGWVPFFQAAEIYTNYPKDTPLAATLRKIFKPRPGKSPGLRYDIWIS
jgi:hypothetical protein